MSDIKLCKDCKWYGERTDALSDICLHDKAIDKGGAWVVRGGDAGRYSCRAMRAGICGGDLFEQKEDEPISGSCIECKCDTENQDEGDWICENCLEDSRAARREDERLDDPRHMPYAR